MHTLINFNKPLFSDFTIDQINEINCALSILEQIPPSSNTHLPTGIEVATFLDDYNVDFKTVLATLLSDPRLAEHYSTLNIKAQFGDTVAILVHDVNWLNKQTVYTPTLSSAPHEAETLRRMLLSMTRDVRSILIKLAYRLLRLRNLPKESLEIRQFISHETLDIYAPIANRLGIHQVKWELEDMAFRYINPQDYKHIAKSLAAKRLQRESCIKNFVETLQHQLSTENINSACYGRPKHIYSIWKKMQKKQLDITQLYDLLAVRVIVDNLIQCYTVLGIVHSLWEFIPKEFDDYIANPKENGYQSLHTVINDENGNRIEVQIRTQAMHDYAELGVAAHWSYKEGGKQSAAMEKSVATLRKLLNEKQDEESLAQDFHSDLFSDKVYVLSPANKVIELPKGATPLDFAYAIHTNVGHRCRGAKINSKIMPLTYSLKSGEQIEILTTKVCAPNRNWIDPNLGYLKTSRAINRVKSWFRNDEKLENINRGKLILEKECKHLGLKTINMVETLHFFKQANAEAFYEAIGRNEINERQLAGYFKIPEPQPLAHPIKRKTSTVKLGISVAGINNIETSLAHCCAPTSDDLIIGYISHHHGITVHRLDCTNITHLEPDKQSQLITVSWTTGNSESKQDT
ncbi:MAG: RelA/SpoT family protein [Methylococcales bacterium]|nr:RelA/SpoT family protein [Methylococcales bacterium]